MLIIMIERNKVQKIDYMLQKKKRKEDWQSVAERDVSRDIVEVFRVVLLDMLIIL